MKNLFNRIIRGRAIFGVGVLLITLTTTGALCGGQSITPPEWVTLEIWRAEDDDGAFADAKTAYSAAYPHVGFDVRTFKAEEYEDALFNAWAKGEGPDIFSVPNWRLGRYHEFITTMPESVSLKTSHIESHFGKKEAVTTINNIAMPTVSQIKDTFVNTVFEDVVVYDKVYGLPLSMDTLVMYYNRDLLARSNIAIPPTTWEEFRNAVQIMTELDDERNVVAPAAALGTSENIPYFFDIVSVLMMQNGATMATPGGRVVFNGADEAGRFPGAEAIDFYTKFSNSKYKTYTWNDQQLNAIEAFTQGNLGFYFGYLGDEAVIQKRAPNLNYSHTYLPQIDPNNYTNYANYNVETVHVNAESPEHAWNFIRLMAMQEDQNRKFLDYTGRSAALKSILNTQQTDPELGVFAQQALTAKSWYHGFDPDAAVSAFTEMIDSANEHLVSLEEIMTLAVSKVRLTVQQ